MKKIKFSEICEKYQIDPKALKRALKDEGFSRKEATDYEVFQTIFIHSTDLMYCRANEFEGGCDYLNPMVPSWLIEDMKAAKEVMA